jgi:hypothetical protein
MAQQFSLDAANFDIALKSPNRVVFCIYLVKFLHVLYVLSIREPKISNDEI